MNRSDFHIAYVKQKMFFSLEPVRLVNKVRFIKNKVENGSKMAIKHNKQSFWKMSTKATPEIILSHYKCGLKSIHSLELSELFISYNEAFP